MANTGLNLNIPGDTIDPKTGERGWDHDQLKIFLVNLANSVTVANSSANIANSTLAAAYNQANAAYDQANNALGVAKAAYGEANTASAVATEANTTATFAIYIAEQAFGIAETANAAANLVAVYQDGNLVIANANVNFNASNTVNANVTIGSNGWQANIEFEANGTAIVGPTADIANTANLNANLAYGQANLAYAQANIANAVGTVALAVAELAYAEANAATANILAINATFGTINSAISNVSIQSNAAANTVQVSQDGTLVLSDANLNFNHTGTINVSVTAHGQTANIALTANDTALGIPAIEAAIGTLNTAVVAIDSALASLNTEVATVYTAVNAAANTVAVYANGTLILSAGKLTFNDSPTINVNAAANGTTGSNVSLSVNASAIHSGGVLAVTSANAANIIVSGNSTNVVIDTALSVTGGGGTPTLPNTALQFNQNGVFGGSANLTFDYPNNIVAISTTATNFNPLVFNAKGRAANNQTWGFRFGTAGDIQLGTEPDGGGGNAGGPTNLALDFGRANQNVNIMNFGNIVDLPQHTFFANSVISDTGAATSLKNFVIAASATTLGKWGMGMDSNDTFSISRLDVPGTWLGLTLNGVATIPNRLGVGNLPAGSPPATTNYANSLIVIQKYVGGTAPADLANGYHLQIGGVGYGNTVNYELIGFGYSPGLASPAYIGYEMTSQASFTTGDVIIGTRSTTTDVQPTERMRIANTGSVGIGVNPDSFFHVAAPSSLGGMRIAYNGTSQNYYDGDFHYFRTGNGSVNNLVVNVGGVQIFSSGGYQISSSGVSTGSKLFKFAVSGASSLYGYTDSGGAGITDQDPYTAGSLVYLGGNQIGCYTGGGQRSVLSNTAFTSLVPIVFPSVASTTTLTGANIKFGIGISFSGGQSEISTGSDRLGIGTTGAANLTLYTNSTAAITMDSAQNVLAAASLHAVGNISSGSDRRLKKNIRTIDNPISKIQKLRGVNFDRVKDGVEQMGLIAQEVEPILPEVITKQDDGMLGISYGNIVGLLIESTKEQQKQIATLQTQIDELKRPWWKKWFR